MTKWHAYVVHMAKHINMVVGPFLVRALHPGRLSQPPKSCVDRDTDEWEKVKYAIQKD